MRVHNGPSGDGPLCAQGDEAVIPRYDVATPAGGEVPADAEQGEGTVVLPASLLVNLRVPASKLCAINAKGDSMEPTLCDGDLLLVDRNDRRIVSGYIYVLNIDGDLVVKRLRKDLDLILVSDNPTYPDRVVPRHEAPEITVVGRVVWTAGAR